MNGHHNLATCWNERKDAQRATVLIVEDEPFALLYAAQLFQDPGVAVLEAENHEKALGSWSNIRRYRSFSRIYACQES